MIKKLKKYLSDWRERRERLKTRKICEGFRREARFWGYDFSDWTDEELLAGAKNAAEKFRTVGYTAHEISENIIKMAQILTNQPIPDNQ